MPDDPLYPDLDESPLFAARTVELEAGLGRLSERVAKFVRGARCYTAELERAHDATLQFSSSLQDFCIGDDGTDEESMSLGGPLLARFVSTLEELASFQILLRTQVEVILCERLDQGWSGELARAKAARRAAERAGASADAARTRALARGEGAAGLLGWPSVRPPSDRAREADDASKLAEEAAEGRYEVARLHVGLVGRRRHDFLGAVVASMDALSRFFEHSSETASRLRPYIAQARKVSELRMTEAQAEDARMEEQIAQHKEATKARLDQFKADIAETTQQRLSPPGPLQMTASSSAMAAEIEPLIRATHESRGTDVSVLKQGYLRKQGSGFRHDWQRRFFVLDSAGMLYYWSAKDAKGVGGGKKPRATVNLLTATIKAGAEDAAVPNAFRVVGAGDRGYSLQAEDAREALEWTDAIQAVISCLLNGAAGGELEPGAAVPRRPSRPMHLRTRSSVQGSAGGVREMLRGVPGNAACADCGAPDPDWGSLNLGVLLCITCGGAHRTMGVHVSKLRSLTLDTRAWDEHAVALQRAIGNDAANEAWEARLPETEAARPSDEGLHDDWVWGADSDGEEGGLGGTLSAELRGAGGGEASARPPKPDASAPAAEKHAYVITKYYDRAYALALENPQDALWEACASGDVRGAYRALVAGAEVDHLYETPGAVALVAETSRRVADADAPLGGATALHAASMNDNVALGELLLQWGASIDARDAAGQTPLSHALARGRPATAALLLARGANPEAAGTTGRPLPGAPDVAGAAQGTPGTLESDAPSEGTRSTSATS